MRLHLLAVPHTVTSDEFSHCAFTGKVQRFSPMLRAQGFHVVHYGVEGSRSGADEDVVLLDTARHLAAMGMTEYDHGGSAFVGSRANIELPVYKLFNSEARRALECRLEPGDLICLPFSFAHHAAWKDLPMVLSGDVKVVEIGIGYPEPVTNYRIYESEAWRHWMMGREGRSIVAWDSSMHEWVIPNYYDEAAWPLGAGSSNRIVYFGRIDEVKGCAMVPFLARALPDLKFVLCGQGDPGPFLVEPNIAYQPPLYGNARADFLGSALASIHPSRFVEPFCGAAVEAMLCGTPAIASEFGAFTETILEGVTGFRCGNSVASWVDAIEKAKRMDRVRVRENTVRRYSLSAIGPRYAKVFQAIADMK